jgi:hypothetical protein
MKLDRSTLLLLVIVFAAGWWTSSRPAPTPGPTDRPVLRWIAKAAKSLLWIALVAEPAPPDASTRVVRTRVDREGFEILDNAETL